MDVYLIFSTRAVMVEFTLYSVTADLYISVQLVAEFSLSGNLIIFIFDIFKWTTNTITVRSL